MPLMTETKAKKRKGAPEPSVTAKKTKVSAENVEPAKPKSALKKKTASRTIVKDAPAVAEKPAKKTRKSAAVEDKVEPAVETVTKAAPAKAKKTKKTKTSASAKDGADATETEETSKSARAARPVKPAKQEEKIIKALAEADDGEEEVEEDGIDDQTAALLAGFESSEDENDPEDEGIPLDQIPDIPDDKQMKKAIKEAQQDEEHTPGVLYVGRIPHGFYEHQMRSYFAQFGVITHLRLSRNKVTGRPKHYAFVEFASGAVSDIVAKTMDKYLMFGHILQVRRIPAEQVHANLWKGEGKRFKAMPRNKIEGGLLRRGTTREVWAKRVQNEEKKRNSKAKKLKEMGYEFEMPSLKKVDDVPVQEVVETVLIGGEGDEPTTTEASTSEKPEEIAAADRAEAETDEVEPESTAVKRKKAVKGKKTAKKVKV